MLDDTATILGHPIHTSPSNPHPNLQTDLQYDKAEYLINKCQTRAFQKLRNKTNTEHNILEYTDKISASCLQEFENTQLMLSNSYSSLSI